MTVRQKQWQLWLLGYYDGVIDGVWGALSAEATQDLHLRTDRRRHLRQGYDGAEHGPYHTAAKGADRWRHSH